MTAFGIDFGACECRTATAHSADGRISPARRWRFESAVCPRLDPMPFAFKGDSRHRFSYQSVPLKRLLTTDYQVSTGGDRPVLPPAATAMLFGSVRMKAGNAVNRNVQKCAVAIHPCFSDNERSIVYRSAMDAGYSEVRLIDDARCAAAAHAAAAGPSGIWAIVGFGKTGMFASVVNAEVNLVPLSHNGYTMLGGDDLDPVVVDAISAKGCLESCHHLLNNDPSFARWILTCVESMRRRLSIDQIAAVSDSYCDSETGLIHKIVFEFERKELNVLLSSYMEEVVRMLQMSISEASLTPANITHVLLVGGVTSTPLLRQRVAEAVPRAQLISLEDDAIVRGAALSARVLGNCIEPAKSPEHTAELRRYPGVASAASNAAPTSAAQAPITPVLPTELQAAWASVVHAKQKKDLDSAITSCQDFIMRSREQLATIYCLKGKDLQQMGDIPGALRFWEAALKEYPYHKTARELLVLFYYRKALCHWDNARDARNSKERRGQVNECERSLKYCFHITNNYIPAVELFERLHQFNKTGKML